MEMEGEEDYNDAGERTEYDENSHDSGTELTEQRQVPSLRGAPSHMRSSIRRLQNVEVRSSSFYCGT
eukprot:IDg18494t1